MTDLAGNADWHLHNIDLPNKRVLMLELDREIFREASFLDGRVERLAHSGMWYSFDQVQQAFPTHGPIPARLNFIFHIGHCGSTLISRMLDTPAGGIVYREPLSMRFLSNLHRLMANPDPPIKQQFTGHWTRIVLKALGRGNPAGGTNLVKTSSTGNNLAVPLLGVGSEYRALLIHVDLPAYLATMLKGDQPRQDIRGFAAERLNDFARICPAVRLDPEQLENWQILVITWLSNMYDQQAASQAFPDRTLRVDFDDWLAAPLQQSREIASFLGLDTDAEQLAAAWDQHGGRYAKATEHPYSAGQRQAALLRSQQQNGPQIKQALGWAEVLLREHRQFRPLAADAA